MPKPAVRSAAYALTISLVSSVSSAQYLAPYGVVAPPGYYGCSGIYLELARQNDDLSRIRARLRRLETETDESARARQWISTLEAENRNLRQQNMLLQRQVMQLEATLETMKSDPNAKTKQ